LYKTLQELFPPGVDILEEYQFPAMLFVKSRHLMIFDIYVPSLNIIFEYHGYHHYYNHSFFGDVKSHKELDNEKRFACDYHNITYLEVPYWWQNNKESIIELVHQVRPDIIPILL